MTRLQKATEVRLRNAARRREHERLTGLRVCVNCGPVPLAMFYKSNRSRRCKVCLVERVKELRSIQQAVNCDAEPVSKQLELFKVHEAVKRGARTREEIKRQVQLGWDDVTDALAVLSLVQRVLVSKRINGEAYFYERAA